MIGGSWRCRYSSASKIWKIQVKTWRFWQRSGRLAGGFAAHLFQVFPLDIFHHQILALVRQAEMVGHPRQVRMVQVGQDLRFASELAGGFRRGIQVFFERERDVQVQIPNPVDCAKATLTQQPDDPITVDQNSSRCQRHSPCLRSLPSMDNDILSQTKTRLPNIKQAGGSWLDNFGMNGYDRSYGLPCQQEKPPRLAKLYEVYISNSGSVANFLCR